MRLRISIRGRVRSFVRPSVRPYVPCYFQRWKVRILGATCAVYPALFPFSYLFGEWLIMLNNRLLQGPEWCFKFVFSSSFSTSVFMPRLFCLCLFYAITNFLFFGLTFPVNYQLSIIKKNWQFYPRVEFGSLIFPLFLNFVSIEWVSITCQLSSIFFEVLTVCHWFLWEFSRWRD